MREPRLLRDIAAQPESLAGVLRRQAGEGREALRQAAETIRSARRVIVTGMGASLYAATPLYYRLAALEIDAALVESGELLHYLRNLCEDAVLLAVSRSGETVEIVKLLPELGPLGCRVVGVTNDAGSALALGAECAVEVGSLPDEMVAIQSYTGTLLALHLLGGEVAGEFDDAHGEAARLIDALPEFIEAQIAAVAEWDGFLDPALPIHLLGRGPSYGSALEGGLLFGETAKAAAFGMPSGTFRHGPVESVDASFRGLIFAPQGPTRHLDLALARDLTRFGGQVRVIEAPAQLAEIIPVQLAALRLAQLKGLTPGVFRHAPQVTRNEESF